jgi:ribose/xylose/arabinose/galactoside ABC-type transport system permease subunit
MKNKKFIILDILKNQSQIIILILMVVLFSIIIPNFGTIGNFINLLKQITIIGLISCGMTMVVVTGNLDLSVGSVFSLLTIITILLQQKNNFLAIVGVLIAAVFIGIFNGFIITKFKANSIIVTLGSLSFFSGLALITTNGAYVFGNPATWFDLIGQGKFMGIPNFIYILLFFAIITHIILTNTTFGRKIKYVGTNISAAEIVGLRSDRVITTAFIISSVSVAIAALVFTSRNTAASPVVGIGFEFDAITAIVIGGTSLTGGKGSIFKTIIGVLLLAVIINALTLYNIPFGYQNVVKGILIITAIIIDVRARKSSEI